MSDSTTQRPLSLPPPFHNTHPPPIPIQQGAEAHLLRTTYLDPDTPAALKVRPTKPYRHPILDARLTKARVLAEARVLVRLRREGISVPAVYAVDWGTKGGAWILMEWIVGERLREMLMRGGKNGEDRTGLKILLSTVGFGVGKMHSAGVIHGDLTTSNVMVRGDRETDVASDGKIVLIDFGLATQSAQDEDRAVDLYVLERAFGSTHPKLEEEGMFEEVLRGYREGLGKKISAVVLKRLEDVRLRGRKRSMVG